MAKTKIQTHCPKCSAILRDPQSINIGTSRFTKYACGHMFSAELGERRLLDFTGIKPGFVARPYQAEGVDFIVNGHPENPGGFNCIIGDKMRLGKTPQSLIAIKNALVERTPVLILVKGANLPQWIREFKTWTSADAFGIWEIKDGRGFIPPSFAAYIISMDLLSSEGTCKRCAASSRRHSEEGQLRPCKKTGCIDFVPSGDSMVEKLLAFGFKCVIADEAHSFKNTTSARAQAFLRFINEISKSEQKVEITFNCGICKHVWIEESVRQINSNGTAQHERIGKHAHCPACHAENFQSAFHERLQTSRKCGVIMLTGTGIKNNAGEYFVPLNIVAPERFPSFQAFKRQWCVADGNGRLRVREGHLEAFRDLIAPYVLRREWEDVYTDLPPLNRETTIIKVEDENLKKLYNATLDDIEEKLSSKGSFKVFDSIGELARLRQICGLAKCQFVAEKIKDQLDENPDAKFVIGLHHHSVRDQLAYLLEPYGVCKIDGQDSNEQKDAIMTGFQTSDKRVCLMNMLAGGVGLDMYYVENVIIMERQWSSADEEQFEARFFNPDGEMVHGRLNKLAESNGRPATWGPNHPKITNIEYVIAAGTIDEFFQDMVSQKREIFGETIQNDWDMMKSPESFRELMEKTVAGRL